MLLVGFATALVDESRNLDKCDFSSDEEFQLSLRTYVCIKQKIFIFEIKKRFGHPSAIRRIHSTCLSKE